MVAACLIEAHPLGLVDRVGDRIEHDVAPIHHADLVIQPFEEALVEVSVGIHEPGDDWRARAHL